MTVYEEYEQALEHYKAMNVVDPESPLSSIRDRAITAIIKQIPVEPVGNRCPYCGRPFMIKTLYCGNCGQAMK